MILPGKGMFTWKLRDVYEGDPQAIADLARLARLSHVLVKIADGVGEYNVSVDLPVIVQALQRIGVVVFGWHYVYGEDPTFEASRALRQIEATGVTGYVIDAEVEYKEPGKANSAEIFMDNLGAGLPSGFPIGLSSYRYPSYHPQLPWEAFLEGCTFVMPQVYWQGAHNPAAQLERSYNEFSILAPELPFLATGAAYTVGGWAVLPGEVGIFLDKCRELGIEGANFWELAHARRYLPEVWGAIMNYDWPVLRPEPEPEPGGDEMAIVEELQGIRQVLGEIRDRMGEGSGGGGGGTEPEPEYVRIIVTDEGRTAAKYSRRNNKSGWPIMEIYEGPNGRVTFNNGTILQAYPDLVRADGSTEPAWYKLAPVHIPEGAPDLYLQLGADVEAL